MEAQVMPNFQNIIKIIKCLRTEVEAAESATIAMNQVTCPETVKRKRNSNLMEEEVVAQGEIEKKVNITPMKMTKEEENSNNNQNLIGAEISTGRDHLHLHGVTMINR